MSSLVRSWSTHVKLQINIIPPVRSSGQTVCMSGLLRIAISVWKTFGVPTVNLFRSLFEGKDCGSLLFVYSSSRRRQYIWVTAFLVMYLAKSLIWHGQFHDHSFGDLIFDLSSGVLWSIMLTNHRSQSSCKSYSDTTHLCGFWQCICEVPVSPGIYCLTKVSLMK